MQAEGASQDYSVDNIEAFIGKNIGVSRWHIVSQQEICDFASATHDLDPNHIDPDWAREHSPYGFPIAFGFQSLSLLTYLCKDAGLKPSGTTDEYNYGFDKVRFLAPVPADCRVRTHVALKDARRKGSSAIVLRYEVSMEIEGGDKPALVADWLVMCGLN